MVFYDSNQESNVVFVYALSTCSHCRAAKKLLDDLGCSYSQVEVDQLSESDMDDCLAEMSHYNPAQTFPTLIIGSKIIVGNRTEDIKVEVMKFFQRNA